MFKSAISLEETGKINIIALDKTGTVTAGVPEVTDIYTAPGVEAEDLLSVAYSLEDKSEHPLARAITLYGSSQNIKKYEVEDFRALPGNGLTASYQGKKISGGNYSFVSTIADINQDIKDRAEAFADEGKTPLYFAGDNQILGIIAVADVIKKDSAKAVKELKNMGIHVVLLTGDNEKTARAIGRQIDVDEVVADVLPAGKEKIISRLKEQGKVAMVGDGINDAPALTGADIGIAIGTGTDIAIDAADVVVMNSRLTDVTAAIRLSRKTLKNIHENLFWAFFYNVIGIPLAAGIWIPIFGWELNPMFAAAAMSLSSFCVVTNALRLNLCKIYDERKDKKKNNKKEEDNVMIKTMIIQGMMCGHCEGRVKKALEELPQVAAAEVSHEKGTAKVTLKVEIDDSVLKEAVEAQDYKVTAIE
jgi:Cu2+-exporting ATPase